MTLFKSRQPEKSAPAPIPLAADDAEVAAARCADTDRQQAIRDAGATVARARKALEQVEAGRRPPGETRSISELRDAIKEHTAIARALEKEQHAARFDVANAARAATVRHLATCPRAAALAARAGALASALTDLADDVLGYVAELGRAGYDHEALHVPSDITLRRAVCTLQAVAASGLSLARVSAGPVAPPAGPPAQSGSKDDFVFTINTGSRWDKRTTIGRAG